MCTWVSDKYIHNLPFDDLICPISGSQKIKLHNYIKYSSLVQENKKTQNYLLKYASI